MRPSDRDARGERWSMAILGGGLALGFFLHARAWVFLCDDAFISFRYAVNLAREGALEYNLGERVEGYSNFLWVLLLGLGEALGLAPPVLAPALTIAGAGCLIVASTLLLRGLRGRSGGPWSPGDLAPAALMVASPEVMVWSQGGLETSAAAAFAVAAMVAWIGRRPVVAALFAGLAGLLRADVLLAVASFGVAWLVVRSAARWGGVQRGPAWAGSEGARGEGAGSEGARGEGAEIEGSGSEGSGSEGAEIEGSGSEGARSEGAGSEGAGSEGAGSEGAGSEGARSEGARSEQARSEQAGSEEAGSEGAGSEQAGSEQAGSEEAKGEGARGEEAGSEGAGSEGSGSEGARGEGARSEGSAGIDGSAQGPVLGVGVRRLLVAGLLFVALIGGHLLFRRLYYGAWAPNTWAIKSHGALLRGTHGVAYLEAWASGLGLGSLTGLAALMAAALAVLRSRALVLALPIVGVALYAWSVGGDFMAYSRFLVVASALVAVLLSWALFELCEGLSLRWRGFRPLGAVVVMGLALLLGVRSQERWAADMAQHAGWLDGRWEGVRAMDHFALQRLHAGAWMREHLPPETLITVGAAGALPYASMLPTIDAYGLVDPVIAHLPGVKPVVGERARPGHQIGAPTSYLRERDPDLFCHVGFVGPRRPTPAQARRRGLGPGFVWACVEPAPVAHPREPEGTVGGDYYCCLRPRERRVGPFGG